MLTITYRSGLKRVFSLRADNQYLPYPDNFFDLYISNMILSFTPEPKKMISEAYRTLQEGGVCAIATTIKFEEMNPIKFIIQAVTNLGITDIQLKTNMNYISREELEEIFKETGFSVVKSYVNKFRYWLRTPADLDPIFLSHPSVRGIIDQLDEKGQKDVFDEYHRITESVFGKDTNEVLYFDGFTIIAQK